jgi:FkbM family methyltransferase
VTYFPLFYKELHLMATQEILMPRASKRASLYNIRTLGFYPSVVIDVGAQIGTPELYECFPRSKHLLIEPVKEHEPQLLNICRQLPDAEVIIAAATSVSGPVTLTITPNCQYAAVVETVNEGNGNTYRTVPGLTLDDICRERHLQGPWHHYLIKIDVDGREIEVLKGAAHILHQTEYIVVESTLFGQLYEVMDFMRVYGFVAYDIVDHLYRPVDTALWQVDLAFVKKDGQFRTFKRFANAEMLKTMANRPM